MDNSFDKTSYRDFAYEYIKAKILDFEYPMDSKINISKISQELQISNTPIREALSQLEAEGLVKNIPYTGPKVVNMTERDFYQVRLSLATLYLGCYSMISETGMLDTLTGNYERALELQEKQPADASIQEQVNVSMNVDLQFVKSINNRQLDSMLNSLRSYIYLEAHFDYLNEIYTPQNSIAAHKAILTAMKHQNYNEFKCALLAHYRIPENNK